MPFVEDDLVPYLRDRLVPWMKGLLAAVITGTSTSAALLIADPTSFNFDDPAAIARVKSVALWAGIFGGLAYLKQSPLP